MTNWFEVDKQGLAKILEREEWTPQIARVAEYIQEIAPFLIERIVDVRIANDPTWHFNACYSREKAQITINLGSRSIGHQWFAGNIRHINRLIIHEFAHQYESDHFAEGFHEACCKLGGILSEVALVRPEIFDLKDNARRAA